MIDRNVSDSLHISTINHVSSIEVTLVKPFTNEEITTQIDPISLVSIPIAVYSNDVLVNNATGFVIQYADKGYYLLTNKHVFTSRDQIGNKVAPGPTPTDVELYMHKVYNDEPLKFGEYVQIRRKLVATDITWLQHPDHPEYDVVALKLDIKKFLHEGEKAKIICLDFQQHAAKYFLDSMPPTSRLSIVGYPLNVTAYTFFPIWKTGHLATEYKFDYEGKPVFLTDTSTWPGMSGSPVIARSKNGLLLLGIHSSSFYYYKELKGMDITKAWKTDVIEDIILADKKIDDIMEYIKDLTNIADVEI